MLTQSVCICIHAHAYTCIQHDEIGCALRSYDDWKETYLNGVHARDSDSAMACLKQAFADDSLAVVLGLQEHTAQECFVFKARQEKPFVFQGAEESSLKRALKCAGAGVYMGTNATLDLFECKWISNQSPLYRFHCRASWDNVTAQYLYKNSSLSEKV